MSTPELYLRTGFLFDAAGRIVSTREPDPRPGPLFTLIRGPHSVVCAVRADVPASVAEDLERVAATEPPGVIHAEPRHTERYRSLLGGSVRSGPAFEFPDRPWAVNGPVFVDDVEPLERHFTGWTRSEVPRRTPVAVVIEDGHAVSVCCCARRSDEAAEAGLETAEPFRGRGLAGQVANAWAVAVRESGRIPLYSTEWSNTASLTVARKLSLMQFASWWSIDSD